MQRDVQIKGFYRKIIIINTNKYTQLNFWTQFIPFALITQEQFNIRTCFNDIVQ